MSTDLTKGIDLSDLPVNFIESGSGPEGTESVWVRIWFDNGYGASIIKTPFSYGVELAVLSSDVEVDYTTPVTNDVLGWLDPVTLKEALEKISQLEREVK